MSIFSKILTRKPKRSKFDLSHDLKTSFKMGELVPNLVLETIPNGNYSLSAENMLRMAPMLAPIMHRVNMDTQFFFVPYRILWDQWEQFITGGDENSTILPPTIGGINTIQIGSLGNYMGIPETGTPVATRPISALPAAAYAKIFDEYYRDQNLQEEIFEGGLMSGTNVANLWVKDLLEGSPLKRAWQHDYFTSCLPDAQRGDEVTLPLLNNDTAKVTLNQDSGLPMQVRNSGSGALTGTSATVRTSSTIGGNLYNDGVNAVIDPNGRLDVDINAEASTINTLRRAFQVQKWLEKSMRSGSRYKEMLLSFFGSHAGDARLDRPEFIGSLNHNVAVSEVLSTAQTVGSSDQVTNVVGQQSGHGISVGGGSTFNYTAKEHGVIIGIQSVRPKTAYYQGINKMWTRFDKFDYAWPEFANIGEQEVKMSEIFADTDSAPEWDETFGYIPRYSEYKFMPDRITGEMQSTLSFWHLGRVFNDKPTLNEDFISCDPSERIFAALVDDDHLYLHAYFKIHATLPLPKYGIPM